MSAGIARAVISTAGSAGGGFLTGRQQKRAAKKSRRFAERMANTQYQRGVKDLRKAGLNPMLAYMNLQTSSPNATPAQTPEYGKGVDAAINTGLTASKNPKERQILNDQSQLIQAQTSASWAQQNKIDAEAHLIKQGFPGAENEAWLQSNYGRVIKSMGAAAGTAKGVSSIAGLATAAKNFFGKKGKTGARRFQGDGKGPTPKGKRINFNLGN